MRRHQLHRCKYNNYNTEFKHLYKQSEKEKKKLYKQIEDMMIQSSHGCNMTQNNMTQNNTINNITLNSYGKEDLSHITDDVLDKLIQAPGTMISELLRLIHFNIDKPENMNMCIPNIRDKFIRMFIELEWKLESKSSQIPHLVERSY